MAVVGNSKESGQTLIFSAVIFTFLAMVMGLAIEGGRLFVTYRQMQAAADMAALVGAQSLPNSAQAVAFAQKAALDNGFDSTTTTVSVPPQSQSPYSALPYNTNFIEVQISNTLGRIPIFNTPVTLYAHAVARHGIPDISDYAIAALNPGSVNGISINGNNGILAYGSVLSNSSNTSCSSGAVTTSGSCGAAGPPWNIICDGLWYAYAAEPDPGKLESYDHATGVNYAPPSCQGGTADSSNEWAPNAGQIADSYGTTIAPSTTNITGCSECEQGASNTYFYTWTVSNSCGNTQAACRPTGTWHTASESNQPKISGGGNYMELFPGTYPNGITVNGGTVYFNPGVYTLGNDFHVNGGTVCIYGAPVCDVLNSLDNGTGTIPGTPPANGISCATASFDPSVTAYYVNARQWYYYCSPWGFYDTSPPNPGGTRPSAISPVPYFTDGSTPLDGVTLYFSPAASGSSTNACSASCNVDIQGSSGGIDLAFPNPCPGTGTGTKGDPSGTPLGVVDFPAGWNMTNPYKYPANSLPTLDNTSPPSGTQLYPNGDLTSHGDCNSPPVVWTGEFGASQPGEHLNFLVFAQNTSTGFSLQGSSTENWWGILHTFPCASGPCTLPPSSPCLNCSVKVAGSNGAQPGGPPTLFGQVVADTVTFGGSSTVAVFNRPGGQASGAGTSLVE